MLSEVQNAIKNVTSTGGSAALSPAQLGGKRRKSKGKKSKKAGRKSRKSKKKSRKSRKSRRRK